MRIHGAERAAQDIDARLSEGISTSVEDMALHITECTGADLMVKLCDAILKPVKTGAEALEAANLASSLARQIQAKLEGESDAK